MLYLDHEVRWFLGCHQYCSLSSEFERSVLSINVTEAVIRKSFFYKTNSDPTNVFACNIYYVSVFYSHLYNYFISNRSQQVCPTYWMPQSLHVRSYRRIFVTIKLVVYFISFASNCASKSWFITFERPNYSFCRVQFCSHKVATQFS